MATAVHGTTQCEHMPCVYRTPPRHTGNYCFFPPRTQPLTFSYYLPRHISYHIISHNICYGANQPELISASHNSRLFSQSTHSNHCLHHVFTHNNRSSLALRERGHPFKLPRYKYDLARKSFIMRALYEFL